MRILPVVKAYPVVDHVSFSEAVCVAGITLEQPHSWVRLFPLDFRGLERAQQFKKYEVTELEARRSAKDPRPESYTPMLTSIVPIEHISTDNGTWRRRLSFVDAVADESMCEIQRKQRTSRQSLGVFRPAEVRDLKVARASPEFEASQRAVIEQGSLLGDRTGDKRRSPLEPLPVKSKFEYRCSDAACRGHEQSFVDWELGAFYRRLRDEDGLEDGTCRERIRERFLGYCDGKHDVRFITGSMASHPRSFLVLGLVYPKRKPPIQETTLF